MGNRSKQLPESIVQCGDCLAAMIRYCDRDDLQWSWSWCATARCSGGTRGLAAATLRKLLSADNQENPAIIYGWILAQLWIIFHAFHLFQEIPTTSILYLHVHIIVTHLSSCLGGRARPPPSGPPSPGSLSSWSGSPCLQYQHQY